MQTLKVLLRPAGDNTYEEVAVVTAVRGKTLRLRLGDDSEAEHERGRDERTPDRWSYAHLSLVAPEILRAALAEAPMPVVKQHLMEATGGMSATELRRRIAKDFDAKLADKAWSLVTGLLADDPEIGATDAKQPVFKFLPEVNVSFRRLFPTEARVIAPVDTPGPTDASAVVSNTLVKRPPDNPLPAPVGTETPSPTAQPTEESPGVGSRDPGTDPVTLRGRLRLVVPSATHSEVADLPTRPLALSQVFNRLSTKDQRRLLEGLESDDRTRVALASGAGKGGLLGKDLEATSVEDYRRTIDLALKELEQHHDGLASSKRSLLDLAKRVASVGALSADRAVSMARIFAASPTSADGLAWALQELATEVSDRVGRAGGPPLDLASIAIASRAAPLDRSGPRARFLLALHRVDPREAARIRWWDGAGVSELAEAARGPLAAVLDSPAVAGAVVRPAVLGHLSGTPTRATVAAIFGWPSALAGLITGSELARVLGSLARSDRLVADWIRVIAEADRFSALEKQLAAQQDELTSHRAQVAALNDELVDVRESLSRTAGQLAAAKTAGVATSDAHDRQTRIDGVRAVATLAAQVLQSPGACKDNALVRQVEHGCAREGLEPVGTAGDPVTFDPVSHDSLTPRLVPGSPAVVVRGGYTWLDGSDRVVILKAQVVAAQE